MARDPTAHLPPDRSPQWTILYDSDCGFCRWSLAQVLAADRRAQLRPVALGTPEADVLLADMPDRERAASWHLVSPAAVRQSAGAAAPPLLRLLPGGRAPAAALAAVPNLTERAYRWVADHRSLLSKAIPAKAKDRATKRIERAQDSRPVD